MRASRPSLHFNSGPSLAQSDIGNALWSLHLRVENHAPTIPDAATSSDVVRILFPALRSSVLLRFHPDAPRGRSSHTHRCVAACLRLGNPGLQGAAKGIAVREVPLKSGRCDYLLLVDRKPIGVVEAKKKG